MGTSQSPKLKVPNLTFLSGERKNWFSGRIYSMREEYHLPRKEPSETGLESRTHLLERCTPDGPVNRLESNGGFYSVYLRKYLIMDTIALIRAPELEISLYETDR